MNQFSSCLLSIPWNVMASQRICSIRSLSSDGGRPWAGRSSRSAVTSAASLHSWVSLTVIGSLMPFTVRPAPPTWTYVDRRMAPGPRCRTHWP